MEKKLKVGVIGCGCIANGKHLPALKKVEEVEKSTAVYVGNNSRLSTNICCCHFDYCFPYDMEAWEYVPSRFRPKKRDSKCIGCGVCAEVCQFGAINEDGYVIDPEKCKGCGNCVVKCSGKALKMEIVHPADWIPATGEDMKATDKS